MNVYACRFGIKGKIDLTVETHLKEEKSKKILPLELKTGKPSYSVEHKGQVCSHYSGPSFSKLTMLLVNDSLTFTLSDTQIH